MKRQIAIPAAVLCIAGGAFAVFSVTSVANFPSPAALTPVHPEGASASPATANESYAEEHSTTSPPSPENATGGGPPVRVSDLSLREKAGQRLIVGFAGTEVTPLVRRLFRKVRPGGVLLLQRNIRSPAQVRQLIGDLQEIAMDTSGVPLFVAVDQEGGRVCRLTFLNCTPQSAVSSERSAAAVGYARGLRLADLGVTMNLAPVLDKTSPGDFVHNRTFRASPSNTSRLGRAMAAGLADAGVVPVAKHFPGYGGIAYNPETLRVPVMQEVPSTRSFRGVAAATSTAVMLSSVIYRDIHTTLPHVLSSQGVAHAELFFGPDTLLLTDDISTPALRERYGVHRTAFRAAVAGVDMLIVDGPVDLTDPYRAARGLRDAIRTGTLSSERFDASVRNILSWKHRYGLWAAQDN